MADIEARHNSCIYVQKLEIIHLFMLSFYIVIGFAVVRISFLFIISNFFRQYVLGQ